MRKRRHNCSKENNERYIFMHYSLQRLFWSPLAGVLDNHRHHYIASRFLQQFSEYFYKVEQDITNYSAIMPGFGSHHIDMDHGF